MPLWVAKTRKAGASAPARPTMVTPLGQCPYTDPAVTWAAFTWAWAR